MSTTTPSRPYWRGAQLAGGGIAVALLTGAAGVTTGAVDFNDAKVLAPSTAAVFLLAVLAVVLQNKAERIDNDYVEAEDLAIERGDQ